MAKPGFWEDTFEQLVELGQSTAKKSVKQITQTFSPLKLIDQLTGKSEENAKVEEEIPKVKDNNHTPLNFEKLQKKYQEQEKQKLETLRQRLFQMVKREEENALEEQKKKKEEERRKLFYEEQEKKKKEIERKREEQTAEIPKGKIRRSIFSPIKVAKRQQAEVKPAAGKQ